MKVSEAIELFQVKLVAASVSEKSGIPIHTVQCRVPVSFLAQLNTHADLCRSAESARAIPMAQFREKVLADPYIPLVWGKNQRGMSASQKMNDDKQRLAQSAWLDALAAAASRHMMLEQLGCHKQDANRILEPWAWKNVVITATNWDNFFGLRCSHDAQPAMMALAWALAAVVMRAMPVKRTWHLPYLEGDEIATLGGYEADDLALISAARCARVSYAQHGTNKKDVAADMTLARALQKEMHASPFEHVARAWHQGRVGKYRGWIAWRHLNDPAGMTCGVNKSVILEAADKDEDVFDVVKTEKIKKV